jgi:3-oxoadipyl-CoA thiolase
LASVRPDDLAAHIIKAVVARSGIDPALIEDVYFGATNQAGEDNRNVARMAALPIEVPGATINRLCGSGLDAVGSAARAIRCGEAELMIAGGVESMSRAPFVMPKADSAFSRTNAVFDTTIGWRFVNPIMKQLYGTDSMPETAENVAEEHQVTREDQDKFAWRSQQRAARAMANGFFEEEIVRVHTKDAKGKPMTVERDEHPRPTVTLEDLAKLKTPFRDPGTVTAGNASGVNDGAAAMLVASETALKKHGLRPRARVLGMATAGVAPRIMGIGPVPATAKLMARLHMRIGNFDVIELNEAFAAQSLACIRELELDPARVNVNGGAIALGHPLGATGAKLTTQLIHELRTRGGGFGMVTMCIGGGMGAAGVFEVYPV